MKKNASDFMFQEYSEIIIQYTKNEISSEELKEKLKNTLIEARKIEYDRLKTCAEFWHGSYIPKPLFEKFIEEVLE